MRMMGQLKDVFENEVTFEVAGEYNINIHSLDPKKTYSIEVNEKGKQRTLDQNRLLWKLIGEIVKKQSGRVSKHEEWNLYCDALEEMQIAFDYITVVPEAEKRLREEFRVVRFWDTDGKMNTYKVYWGSSHFTTKQMSQLIDVIMDYASLAGVDELEWWREQFDL